MNEIIAKLQQYGPKGAENFNFLADVKNILRQHSTLRRRNRDNTAAVQATDMQKCHREVQSSSENTRRWGIKMLPETID